VATSAALLDRPVEGVVAPQLAAVVSGDAGIESYFSEGRHETRLGMSLLRLSMEAASSVFTVLYLRMPLRLCLLGALLEHSHGRRTPPTDSIPRNSPDQNSTTSKSIASTSTSGSPRGLLAGSCGEDGGDGWAAPVAGAELGVPTTATESSTSSIDGALRAATEAA